jgi:flagellar basal-body rod protein FlgC
MRIGNLAAIAASGMRLETQRLEQSAANTANVETPGYEARRIVSMTLPSGGVTGVSAATYGPHGKRLEDDGSLSVQSNTDIASERVTQLSSLRAFQANVAVLRTSDELTRDLLHRIA